MKISLRLALAALTLALAVPPATAQQPNFRIMVVDMVKLLDEHPNTAEQNAKLTAEQEAANSDLEKLQKELVAMAERYKELDAEAKNPVLAEATRTKAAGDAQKLLAEVQAKNSEGVNYRNQFTAAMQKRIQNFRELMFEEIGKIATEIAKRKSPSTPFVLFDKSGVTALGTLVVVYSEPGFDITDEVLAEINRARPSAPVSTPPAPQANK